MKYYPCTRSNTDFAEDYAIVVEIENTSAKCVRGRAKAMGGVSEICSVREYGPIFWTKIVITFLSDLFLANPTFSWQEIGVLSSVEECLVRMGGRIIVISRNFE